jgi:hypothetical protein
MLLLFPSHPLYPRRPDEHFADEVEAARALGAEVAFFDHDRLTAPPVAEPALLRSWMLTSAAYARLPVPLVTSPAMYARAHELPGWYEAFGALTPASVWAPDVDSLDADALPAGPGIVKDYVKSLKHLWDEACFVPDVRSFQAVAQRFLLERGDDLQGGLVLRAFEPFAGAEARSWWRDGRCVLVTAHPDTPDSLPADVPVSDAAEAVAALGCAFVTVDWARRSDGVWRVVEVGDGQVSDRPRSTPADVFLEAILRRSTARRP